LIVLSCLFSLAFSANSWYVSPFGNDNNSGSSASSPFKTISKAVAGTSAGDTVYLEEGAYGGPLNQAIYINSNITITTDGNPVVVNNQQTSGFIVNNGISLTLIGLSMTNGYTLVNVGYGSELIAQDCTFSYSIYGIITYVTQAVTVTNCEFIGNTYAGIYAYGASTVYLSGCSFSGNNVGVLCSGSTVTDIGSSYTNNYGYSGAAVSVNDNCVYTAVSSVYRNNLGSDFGNGGALDIASSTVTISNAIFYNNTGSADGGAFYCGYSSVVNFYDTTFSSNSAAVGGVGDCYSTCSMVCANCILENNESLSGNDGSCDFGMFSTTGGFSTGSTGTTGTTGTFTTSTASAIKIN